MRKPSDDGDVDTLSVLDEQGQEMLIISDCRRRGEQESGAWRRLLDALPDHFLLA